MQSRSRKNRNKAKRRIAEERRAIRVEIFSRGFYLSQNHGTHHPLADDPNSKLWKEENLSIFSSTTYGPAVLIFIGPNSKDNIVFHKVPGKRTDINYEKVKSILPVLRKLMVLDDLTMVVMDADDET